jgi:hypothetical protein
MMFELCLTDATGGATKNPYKIHCDKESVEREEVKSSTADRRTREKAEGWVQDE